MSESADYDTARCRKISRLSAQGERISRLSPGPSRCAMCWIGSQAAEWSSVLDL
ncbi:MAG TPA: hypothetical protein VGH96_15140 [Streptosporangiaceae bacterium]